MDQQLPPPAPGTEVELDDAEETTVAYYPAPWPKTDGGRFSVQILALLATIGAWIWVIAQLASSRSHVDEVASDIFLDASAIQISQVADQAMVDGLVYLGVGFGVTAVAVVAAIVARR